MAENYKVKSVLISFDGDSDFEETAAVAVQLSDMLNCEVLFEIGGRQYRTRLVAKVKELEEAKRIISSLVEQ